MRFTLHRDKVPVPDYKKGDFDIAYEFSKKLYTEMKDFIKATVLFGSAARNARTTGDIDVLVIVDDLCIKITPEVAEAYRIITEKLIADSSQQIHVTTLKLTAFWEYVRSSDPVIVNMLREGIALLDTGFFEPIQALLKQGRIRPSGESIWAYYMRAPVTLSNSKWHLLQATIDLYWAAIDASHAALMKMGEVPPTPEHVPEMLERHLVAKGYLTKRDVEVMRRLYETSKGINHREIKEISGKAYDSYFNEAQAFVQKMRKVIEG